MTGIEIIIYLTIDLPVVLTVEEVVFGSTSILCFNGTAFLHFLHSCLSSRSAVVLLSLKLPYSPACVCVKRFICSPI